MRVISVSYRMPELLSILLLSACGSVEDNTRNSWNVENRDFIAHIQVTDSGEGYTSVTGIFEDITRERQRILLRRDRVLVSMIGPLQENLLDKDLFTATDSLLDDVVYLELESVVGLPRYFANIQPAQEQNELTIYFKRYRHESSMGTHVAVPSPFFIESPLADETYSHGIDDILIRWSPLTPGAAISVLITGDCINATGVTEDGASKL